MAGRHISSSEEPTVQPGSADRATANRFLVLFTGVVTCLVAGVLAVSVYVNSFGYFGDTGYFHVYNDRRAKADFLRAMPREELPQAYFLGSSDMLPFQPAQNEALTGLRTFNLGNFWGRVEEIWGWVNFTIHDLDAPPELIIVGVEPWTFSADTSGPPLLNEYRRRFIVAEDLFKYAPNYSWWRKNLSRILDQLSAQNMEIMAKAVMSSKITRREHTPLPEDSDGTNAVYNAVVPKPFFPEEVNVFYDRLYKGDFASQEEAERVRSDLLDKEYIRRQEVLLRLPRDRMQDSDFVLFEDMIRLARDHDIEVVLVLLPVHPYFRDLMARHTRYLDHIERLNAVMLDLQSRYDNISVVFDASELPSFGGDPYAFHDSNHMTPVNTARILDVLQQMRER